MPTKKRLPEEEAKQEIIQEEIETEKEEIKKIERIKTEEFDKEAWQPKTELGKKVKAGEITNIDEILDKGLKIMESEIVDILLQNLQSELINVGQSKGKFGGGKRSIWRQTQKKTREGNKPHFAALAVIGDKNGHIGVGFGKSKETVPARDKAIRQAKLNVIKIRQGCGSWDCGCGEPHSIPFEVSGKSSSVIIKLIPAPKGTHLCIQSECQKIMQLAGIKDIYSKSRGQTTTRINLIYACFNALQKLAKTKLVPEQIKKLGII